MLDPLLPLAPVLDPVLDPLTIRATRAVQRVLRGPPFRAEHARSRERALAEVLERYLPEAAPLGPRVRRRDREAILHFESIVERAILDLRGHAERRAAVTRFERAAHAVDRVVYKNTPEWLDDPSFDERLRVRTLERLDRMNEGIGAYDAFFTAIEPASSGRRSWISRAGTRCSPSLSRFDSARARGAYA
jgi:Fe-S-cluster formation regulator IscX/YfhJ